MLAGSMPNFATPSPFVDTATKCCRTARSSPSLRRHQTRAEWALVSVSIVVKVLEQTMNRVSSGSRSRVASTRSVPSTLETKRNVMSLVLWSPQSNVERGPLLGHVDLLAAEHGVNAPGQAAFLGQPEQQNECRIGDAMLRVVEIEPGGFGGQTLAPAWIVGEELAQMPL